jgi:hypothetical protein
MKSQDRVAVRKPQGNAQGKPATGEWDGKVVAMGDDFVELEDNTEKAVAASETVRSEVDRPKARLPEPSVPRERRPTLVSSIPAQLARSMMGDLADAAVPAPMPAEVTRRVSESEVDLAAGAEPEESTDTYSVELVDDQALPPAAQVEALVEEARTFMDRGNLGAAVISADQALAEAAKAALPETSELIKVARPLFDRIFAAYVGLLGQVPVRARTDEQLIGQELGERTTYLLKSVDGVKTLEQLSASTGIPAVEAMRIAASLLAAGIVRVAPLA